MEADVESRRGGGVPFVDCLMSVQRWLSELTVVLMALLITAEVICRSLLGFSLLITEELASYFLVVLVFLGMGTALHDGALFRVEFILHALPDRWRQAMQLLFDLLSLAFAAMLAWQMTVLVEDSYAQHVQAPTTLATPLYIPQIVMVVGSVSLVIVLAAQCLARVSIVFRGKS